MSFITIYKLSASFEKQKEEFPDDFFTIAEEFMEDHKEENDDSSNSSTSTSEYSISDFDLKDE